MCARGSHGCACKLPDPTQMAAVPECSLVLGIDEIEHLNLAVSLHDQHPLQVACCDGEFAVR